MEQKAEEYLMNIPMFTKEKHSVELAEKILNRLVKTIPCKIIHVAGTNGKGSVCAFLTSVLVQAGYQVGTFVSPHLEDIRERILINGKMISSREFQSCFEKVYKEVKQMEKEGISHPSYFEFLFYVAMVYFSRVSADYVILETGMGGRLDVTSACNPYLCLITSVGMDHMEYLGDTLEKIAGEKAGIIRPKIPVVFDGRCKETSNVVIQAGSQAKAPCIPVTAEDFSWKLNEEGGSITVSCMYRGEKQEFYVPFPAGYQAANCALAVKALEVMAVPELSAEIIKTGISMTKWPARMEEIFPEVYLDGAHNAHGMEAFSKDAAALLKNKGKKGRLLFAAVSDKEYEKMAKILCQAEDWEEVIVAHIDSLRGLETKRMAEAFQKAGANLVTSFDTVEEAALYGLRTKRPEELLFFAGSLYFAGQVKAVIRRQSHDKF
ncbi:MAG: folylpolyglutamate synthase/dihydrofolate synthase family protein [Lachnoclostridium edouardi]|uniref:bifunctional folylpolyglutamate synthase/dihydrofolate synthase n=1 Tax=Lachnoclostridium edouardi TaxID=1926283 RepID=UPI0026DB4439|nr:folylpolyglutamate synthase/dihydrofolate synthase family protein [Lachnoclostridium edouardi]MDO4279485.1 folylpolyglutamate synthase/dihydrofolate synthase family protein [Lachnoclostridium edouardi]